MRGGRTHQNDSGKSSAAFGPIRLSFKIFVLDLFLCFDRTVNSCHLRPQNLLRRKKGKGIHTELTWSIAQVVSSRKQRIVQGQQVCSVSVVIAIAIPAAGFCVLSATGGKLPGLIPSEPVNEFAQLPCTDVCNLSADGLHY